MCDRAESLDMAQMNADELFLLAIVTLMISPFAAIFLSGWIPMCWIGLHCDVITTWYFTTGKVRCRFCGREDTTSIWD